MSVGRTSQEKINALIKDYQTPLNEDKRKESIRSLLKLALVDNQQLPRITPGFSIKAIEDYDTKFDYKSGRERNCMLLIAVELKEDKHQEDSLKLAIDCYRKSYDMSVRYENFLKGRKYFRERGSTFEDKLRVQRHAIDYVNAVYNKTLFFNEERSKAVEGLIHLAQNSSLVVRERALTALSDIYFYQAKETSPDLEGALDFAVILKEMKVSSGEQQLIVAQLDKAIHENKEPGKIKQGIYKLGELYEKLGNSGKALEKYKQAAELDYINANEKLAQVYEKGQLGQQADGAKAARYYLQIGAIYFSQDEIKRREYLREKNYIESYQNKDKIERLEKEQKSTGKKRELANDYFKKAFELEPKTVEEYLPVLEGYNKMTQLDAIKNALQSLDSREKVSKVIQDIDNRVMKLQISAHFQRESHSNNRNWMTELLTLENEVKKRNITDSKILQDIHLSLTKAFKHGQEEESKKIKQGYQIDSLDKSRVEWGMLFHRMLDTRYSPPHNAATPVADGVIAMLEQKGDFSAKLLHYDFYSAELRFATVVDPPQLEKIDELNKKLVDLTDEILTTIPKLNKSEKKKLQNKGYDTTKLRQECLKTLKKISVEVDSPSTSKANEILRREQSLLSKGFFQIKKMLGKSHLPQARQIELAKLKKK